VTGIANLEDLEARGQSAMAEYVVLPGQAREALWELYEKPMLVWAPLPAALFLSSWLTPDRFIAASRSGWAWPGVSSGFPRSSA